MIITHSFDDETSSIDDVYFVHTVKKGEAELDTDPCFREKEDGYRLIGPGISVWFVGKDKAIDFGIKLMHAFLAGQDDMRGQFRKLLQVY